MPVHGIEVSGPEIFAEKGVLFWKLVQFLNQVIESDEEFTNFRIQTCYSGLNVLLVMKPKNSQKSYKTK